MVLMDSKQNDDLLIWQNSRFHPQNEGSGRSVELKDDSVDKPHVESFVCPICQRSGSNHTACAHSNTEARNSTGKSNQCEELIRTLHSNLHTISLESVVLKSEIEVLRRAFDAKCKVVDILRTQNYQSSDLTPQRSEFCGNEMTVHEELNSVRSELERTRNTLIANQNAWNAKIQQLSQLNEALVQQLLTSERKVKDLQKEKNHLIHRRCKIDENAVVPPTNEARSLLDVSEFDFSDPNGILSAEAVPNAVDSKPPNLSPNPVTPILTTHKNHMDLRLSSNGSGNSSNTKHAIEHVNQQESTSCDTPVARISNQMNSEDLSELVSCTCMPTGPALCECAVQAVRIQRKLLRCRHQLFKETKRAGDLKATIEAYRIALENQFKRNRSLSVELAAILSLVPSKSYQGTLFSDHSITTDQVHITDAILGSNSRISLPSTDPENGEMNNSKILHDLLVWFHDNLDRVASTVNKLNTSNRCSCTTRENFTRETGLYRRGTDSRRESFESLRFSSEDAEYRKFARSSSRHISFGSKRQIAQIRDSRSMTDVRLGANSSNMNESPSISPSRFPYTSSPEQFRKRVQSSRITTHSHGAAAKVRSRARSMEFIPAIHTRDSSGDSARSSVTHENKPSLTVMSELVVKISELCELLAKQELIWNFSRQSSDDWRRPSAASDG